MSTKRRVYQVAKEFNTSIDALLQFLTKANFAVHSHMSPVTEEMYEEVMKKFSTDAKSADGEFDYKRKLKEKKAEEEEKKRKELEEFEERVKISTMMMTEIPKRRKKVVRKDGVVKETEDDDEIEVEEKPKYKVKAGQEKPAAPKVAKRKKAKKEEILEKEISEAEEFEPVEFEPTIEVKEVDLVEEEAIKQPVKEKEIAVKSEDIDAEIKHPEIEKTEHKEEPRGQATEDKKIEKIEQKKLEKEIKKAVPKTEEVKKEKADKVQAEEKGDASTKKKKLKKKERLAIFKMTGPEEGAEEEFEAPKKKKKKKKKTERLDDSKITEKPRKKIKKKRKFVISDEEVEESIRQTFAAMQEAARPKKKRKKVKDAEEETEAANILRVNEFITVSDLANELEIETSELIKKCIQLGMLVTINHRLDVDTIQIVADEYGYEVEIIPEFGSDVVEEMEEEEDDSKLQPRPPVVTIMGHVDHGKTSLLDYIRKSNIIEGEAGGITQHIGAYQVNVNDKYITFLDTPGHEAFTAMRARGAQATDIVILVVAADDNVMPQTIEAIDHAKAAGVPIIVAINKIDKPSANPDMIKKQLADRDVLVEEWGGKYQSVDISAKVGTGVDKLLESILVEAEILELKANPDRFARGVVIESKLDKGKGVVATVLVQKGTLKIGDPFIVGQYYGKVRSLFDEQGKKQKIAGPSMPIQVIGFTGLPQAGDSFIVLESEKDTREISSERQQVKREQEQRYIKHLTLDEISKQIKTGVVKELFLLIKGDVDGSVEAISDSLTKLSTSEVTLSIIRKGVGAISESDVLLASASNAIILGFQVRPTVKAREIAKKENVDIRLYRVIYDAISDIKDALEGLLEPTIEEQNMGTCEVRETFKVPKMGTIAGCYIVSGKIIRNDLVRLYREDKLIFEGRIGSLKRFKEDVKEVASGFECGIGLDGFNDIKVGDIMETYKVIEVKRTLSSNK